MWSDCRADEARTIVEANPHPMGLPEDLDEPVVRHEVLRGDLYRSIVIIREEVSE